MSKRVFIREGILREDCAGGALLGNKCTTCGQIFFPRAELCFGCYGRDMEEVTLSRYGKLYSYTLCHLPSGHFRAPFYVGLVDLPEGVRLFAPLKAVDNKAFEIGMKLKIVVEELWQENGQQVIGYRFTPM